MRVTRLRTIAAVLACAFAAAGLLAPQPKSAPSDRREPAPVALAASANGRDAAVLRVKPSSGGGVEHRSARHDGLPAALLVVCAAVAAVWLFGGNAQRGVSRRAGAGFQLATPSRGPPSFRLVHAH